MLQSHHLITPLNRKSQASPNKREDSPVTSLLKHTKYGYIDGDSDKHLDV